MWAFSGSPHESVSDTSLGYGIMDFPSHGKDICKSMEGDTRAGENDLCDAVLRYINQVLMDDELEDNVCTIQDSTLQATEKSLYEVLDKKCNQLHDGTRSSSDDSITHFSSNFVDSCINACDLSESGVISDLHKFESSHVQNTSCDHTFMTNSPSFYPPGSSFRTFDVPVNSIENVPLENQSSWHFNEGIEESKNILPSGDGGIFYFEDDRLSPSKTKEKVSKLEAKTEKYEGDLTESLLSGRKSLHREDGDLEDERSNKHFAVYAEETILHEMFDKVLSLYDGNDEFALNTLDGPLPNEASREWQQNERVKGSIVELTYTKKGNSKRKAINNRNLLIQCMESVAGNDHRNASKLLRQIRLQSSPTGDGSQRLAHYFANSLEARMVGAGSLAAGSMPYTDELKAYKLHLSAFPFMGTSYFFATQMIMELAEKATSIHIIHFGVRSGLQWPPLIQRLSTRPGGPPLLRITGIDYPQAGFWPDARVKATGRRLARYCERFNVPFQYYGIAQKWETVCIEDLSIEKNEVLVVNSLYQFMHLLDDTIMEQNPRDAVLNLIRRINPDIFIHGIVNANYNSPFFISRFREALFHFSTLFDMFEVNVPREIPERILFEREIWGNEILNIIACEGSERIQRPETYKQWQIRILRAGFRQLPLSQEIVKREKAKVKSCYHKDFFVDEGGQWMLEGWRGRVLFALCCWIPA